VIAIVATICVPAALTEVVLAVTSASAVPLAFTKVPTVAPVLKPVPLMVTVVAVAPTPTPVVPVAYVIEEIVGPLSTVRVNGAETSVAPSELTVCTVSVAEPAVEGGVVTMKLAVVALTYARLPSSPVEPPTVLPTSVEVFAKPVPVRTTVVPTGAPTASAAGAADVIDGPATVKAFAMEPDAASFTSEAV
jgi:hypothetical protein